MKKFRKNTVNANKCENLSCKGLACALKKVFIDIGLSKFESNSMVRIHEVKSAIQYEYLPYIVIENLFDYFQIFFHAFCNSSCLHGFSNAFDINVLQIYKCGCGDTVESASDPFRSLQVIVENCVEFIDNSLEKVIYQQMARKKYKICGNENCALKSSKRELKIIRSPPDCIYIKFDWKTTSDMKIVFESIKKNFDLSEVIANSTDSYELSNVFTNTDYFYLENEIWRNGFSKFFDIRGIFQHILGKNTVITDVIYQKHSRIIPVSQITRIETPNIIKTWLCPRCSYSNPDDLEICSHCYIRKSILPIFTCQTCNKPTRHTSPICESCKESQNIRNFSSSYTNTTCERCGKSTKNSSKCLNCTNSLRDSSNKPLSSSSTYYFKSERLSNIESCYKCQERSGPFHCIGCLETSLTSFCAKCNKKSIYICNNCHKKAKETVERPKSSIGKKCIKCSGSISTSEERNCANCKKRGTEMQCKNCPANGSKKYICDNCLRTTRKISHKNY